jgi:ribosome-associated protein
MEFTIKGDHIELCDLLKVTGLSLSGGEAKQEIADGKVSVDGKVETRKRCKIRQGATVTFAGESITVK